VLTFAAGPTTRRRWSFRTPRGEYFGLTEQEIETVCNKADLFINVSGCCWLRDRYRGCARKIYIDTIRLHAVSTGGNEARNSYVDQAYSVNLILNHDLSLLLLKILDLLAVSRLAASPGTRRVNQ
jgi:hypothetical protein